MDEPKQEKKLDDVSPDYKFPWRRQTKPEEVFYYKLNHYRKFNIFGNRQNYLLVQNTCH